MSIAERYDLLCYSIAGGYILFKTYFNNYRNSCVEATRILTEARFFIYVSFSLFLVGIIAGSIISNRFEELPENFSGMLNIIENENMFGTILQLLAHNVIASFLTLMLGMIFGIAPAIIIVLNGMIIGIVLSLGLSEISLTDTFWAIAPHGIFELPAIIITSGLGLWIGVWIFSKEKNQSLKYRVSKSYHVFVSIILPLMIIAAVIEGYGIAKLKVTFGL